MHRPVGLALVTERLDRWRDGPVSVVVLWRTGPRVLRLLAHRSGRMRAQYNTCTGNIARAVAGPPRSGYPAESPKNARCRPGGWLPAVSGRSADPRYVHEHHCAQHRWSARRISIHADLPRCRCVRLHACVEGELDRPAFHGHSRARLARIPSEQRVQHPRVRQPFQRQARAAQRIDLRMLERHARQRTILRQQRRI